MNLDQNLNRLEGCQIPCLAQISLGRAEGEPAGWKIRVKRLLARPWNQIVKKQAKAYYSWMDTGKKVKSDKAVHQEIPLKKTNTNFLPGDWVRIRTREEIELTLDRWKELKGCAFLENMQQYCGTTQQVLRPVERFLDERDYQVKKCRGVVLLEKMICPGTPVFGRCDRSCYFFWRVEWLEKIPSPE